MIINFGVIPLKTRSCTLSTVDVFTQTNISLVSIDIVITYGMILHKYFIIRFGS